MPSRSRLKIRRKIEFPFAEATIRADKNHPWYPLLPVEQCKGCGHNREIICDVYMFPEPKWEAGKICPMATNVKKEVKKDSKSIDPIKASKAKAKGK